LVTSRMPPSCDSGTICVSNLSITVAIGVKMTRSGRIAFHRVLTFGPCLHGISLDLSPEPNERSQTNVEFK
jgi:hypothetical protein